MGIKTVKLAWVLLLALIASSAAHAELPITPPPADTSGGNGDTTQVALKPDADILEFANGDKLHGNLLSIETGKLTWRYPSVSDLMVFNLSLLKRVSLGDRPSPPIKGDIQILLTNNDILPGKLISIDEKTIKISTGYAREMTIPLPMVRQIYLDSGGMNIYSGPNSEKEWLTRSNRNKRFGVKNGALILESSAVVGTKLNLPDMAKFSFEIPPGPSPRLVFAFYSNDGYLKGSTPNAYILSIYSSSFELERYTDDTGTDTIKEASFEKTRNAPLKVAVFANKQSKQFTITINGRIFGPFTDGYRGTAGKGSNITFLNRSSSVVKLRNISVSRWDGSTIPGRLDASSAKTKLQDTIFFANNDRASGSLISATPKQIVFKTDFAELKAPPSRVSMILLASDKRQVARKRSQDITAALRGGGRVTFALDSLKNGVLTGSSENFGEAKFNLSAFTSMGFNIYNALLQESDESSPDTNE